MNRYLETVRHLSLHQIATRAVRMVQRRWWALTKASAPVVAAAPPIASRQTLWRETHITSRGREIAEGRYTFLSETRVRPSWSEPGASRLWRFHLHSFDYARELEPDTFRSLARSWIDGNRALDGDGWHPYTISLRVVNWCDALLACGDDDAIRASIYAQAEFLSRHLEHDVRGNHLLENARALVRAGAFFAQWQWLSLATELLRREVAEQVFADGGHFERTPSYHVRVMQLLEDAAVFVDAPWLHDAIARMHAFLGAIVPASGRLPLLKDSTLDSAVAGSLTQSRATYLRASGFAIVRDDTGGDFLIADFGRVCPDYLPAHAHADLFSYELTIGGTPTIVDSGVFEYAEGKWRDWFRSTAAHNTIEIDGRDQSEMWGSFRVGRRAHPRNVAWYDTAEFAAIAGEHDGYGPLVHHRTILAVHQERIWIIADRVHGGADSVARSYVHLHPDAAEPKLVSFGGTLSEAEGWYSEYFGEKRRNRVLVLEVATPAWFGHVISPNPIAGVSFVSNDESCTIDIDLGGSRLLIALTIGEEPQLRRT